MRKIAVTDVFAHTSGVWDVRAMRAYARTHPSRVPATVTPMAVELVEHVRASNAWDPARVDALTPRELRDPLLAVELSGGRGVLLVDGTHRLLRLHRDGATHFRVRVFPEGLAERFRVTINIEKKGT